MLFKCLLHLRQFFLYLSFFFSFSPKKFLVSKRFYSVAYQFDSGDSFEGDNLAEYQSEIEVNIPDVSNLPINSAIEVMTSIAFSDDTDAFIYLQSPSGTRIKLSTENGDSSSTRSLYDGVIWTDRRGSFALPVESYSNPVTETTAPIFLKPEEPLLSFVGEDPNGVWVLVIQDKEDNSLGFSYSGSTIYFDISDS